MQINQKHTKNRYQVKRRGQERTYKTVNWNLSKNILNLGLVFNKARIFEDVYASLFSVKCEWLC